MVRSLSNKVLKRRLKVQELRAKGWSQVKIAKYCKVSRKTIERDMEALTLEQNIEPDYTQGRVQGLQAAIKELDEEYARILADLEAARKGSLATDWETGPLGKDQIKDIQTPEDLLKVVEGEIQELRVKRRTILPDWGKVAYLHHQALKNRELKAKLLGLLLTDKVIERVEHETKQFGVIIVPEESKSSKDWQESVKKAIDVSRTERGDPKV